MTSRGNKADASGDAGSDDTFVLPEGLEPLKLIKIDLASQYCHYNGKLMTVAEKQQQQRKRVQAWKKRSEGKEGEVQQGSQSVRRTSARKKKSTPIEDEVKPKRARKSTSASARKREPVAANIQEGELKPKRQRKSTSTPSSKRAKKNAAKQGTETEGTLVEEEAAAEEEEQVTAEEEVIWNKEMIMAYADEEDEEVDVVNFTRPIILNAEPPAQMNEPRSEKRKVKLSRLGREIALPSFEAFRDRVASKSASKEAKRAVARPKLEQVAVDVLTRGLPSAAIRFPAGTRGPLSRGSDDAQGLVTLWNEDGTPHSMPIPTPCRQISERQLSMDEFTGGIRGAQRVAGEDTVYRGNVPVDMHALEEADEELAKSIGEERKERKRRHGGMGPQITVAGGEPQTPAVEMAGEAGSEVAGMHDGEHVSALLRRVYKKELLEGEEEQREAAAGQTGERIANGARCDSCLNYEAEKMKRELVDSKVSFVDNALSIAKINAEAAGNAQLAQKCDELSLRLYRDAFFHR